MDKIPKAIEKIAEESGGKAKVVKVPESMRPTTESLRRLNKEISAQLESNDLMRFRSCIEAGKGF